MKTKKKKESKARKESSVPTKVYAYSAYIKGVTEEHQNTIYRQLKAANRYRNKLVEIERIRRDEYRYIRGFLSAKLESLEANYDILQNQIKEARAVTYKIPRKDRDDSTETIAIRELDSQSRKLYDEIKKERAAVEAEYFAPFDLQLKTNIERERLLFVIKNDPNQSWLLENKPDNMKDAEFKAAKKKSIKKTPLLGPNSKFAKDLVISVRNKMVKENPTAVAWIQKFYIQIIAELANKQARANAKCSTGTYLAVESAAKQSFDDSIFNPKFVPFRGTGKMGMQLTANKGLTIDAAFSSKSPVLKLQIKDVKNSRFGKKIVAATIKLEGKTKNATYIDIPFIMHRELPSDAVIKFVYLVAKKIGYTTKFEIQFTVESNDFITNHNQAQGKVSFNFGWRRLQNHDMQISAVYDGSNKDIDPIIIPANLYERMEKARSILSSKDEYFERAKEILFSWLKKNSIDPYVYDSLFLKNLHQWRNPAKLARVANTMLMTFGSYDTVNKLWVKWRMERVELRSKGTDKLEWAINKNPNKDLFDTYENISLWAKEQGIIDSHQVIALYLEWWRRKDVHLTAYGRNLEARVNRHKKEIYRVAARKLAQQYKECVIEKGNITKLAEIPNIENDTRTKHDENSNALRQFCGVSIFAECLKQAFGKNNLTEVSVSGISQEHFGCGGHPISTKEQNVLCDRCGLLYNQDLSAAKHCWFRSEIPMAAE